MAPESLVLIEGDSLISKEDYEIIQQGLMYLVELTVADTLADIHAEDLGADQRRELAHFDRSIAHGTKFLRYSERTL
jgi:hypothetical protein